MKFLNDPNIRTEVQKCTDLINNQRSVLYFLEDMLLDFVKPNIHELNSSELKELEKLVDGSVEAKTEIILELARREGRL